jgi:hypothetical protein
MLSSLPSAGMCFSKCALSYTVCGLDKCVCNVCVYMYIRMYKNRVFMYTWVCVCVYLCICLYIYARKCIYVYVFM